MGSGLFTVKAELSHINQSGRLVIDEQTEDLQKIAQEEEILQIKYELEAKTGRHSVLTPDKLRHGDLLFPRGSDSESRLIEIGCGTTYSHVGTVIKVSPQFVEILVKFINELPSDWEEKGYSLFSISEETVNAANRVSREVKTKEKGRKDSNSSSSFEMKGPEKLRMSEWSEWFDTFQKVYSHRRCNTYYKRLVCFLWAHYYIHNQETMLSCIYNEAFHVEEHQKELYYWESTTDDTALGLIKGNRLAGVKLTKLKDRACGYEGVIGIRRIQMGSYGSNREDKNDSKDTYTMLVAWICNVMINCGKPYQEDYCDMVLALAYAKYFLQCGYNCRPTIFADDYHDTTEYDSFYCTELSMQLLLDYQVSFWIQEEIIKLKVPQSQIRLNLPSTQNQSIRLRTIESKLADYIKSIHSLNFLSCFTFLDSEQQEQKQQRRYLSKNHDRFYTKHDYYRQSVKFEGNFLNEEHLTNGHSTATPQNPQMQGTSWIGMALIVETILEKLSGLHYHMNQNRYSNTNEFGVPRTNVEILYLTSTKKLPLQFDVSDVKHYRRMQLALDSDYIVKRFQ